MNIKKINIRKYYTPVTLCLVSIIISTVAIAHKSALEITQFSHLTVSNDSSTVYWTSNEKAKRYIEYGENNNFDQKIGQTYTSFSKIHAYSIKNLKPETNYEYRIKSIAETGEQIISQPKSFKTKSESPLNPTVPTQKITQIEAPVQSPHLKPYIKPTVAPTQPETINPTDAKKAAEEKRVADAEKAAKDAALNTPEIEEEKADTPPKKKC